MAKPINAAALLVLFTVLVLGFCNADAESFASLWKQELPHTAMPEALQKLASPLSPAAAQRFLKAKSSDSKLCSSAKIYCPEKALVPVRGPQPRVCIPPFFNYEYGVLPCRPSADAVSEIQNSGIFFTPESLAAGNNLQFPDTHNDLNGVKFLPAAVVDSLSGLEPSHLPELRSFYGVVKGSEMESDMEQTLAHCIAAAEASREVKSCQASGEGMVRFVARNLGHGADVYTPTAMAKQEATVVHVAMLNPDGDKVASCHDMKFPSLLFTCHVSDSSQLMDVTLHLADGSTARQLAVCHMDTSYWNPTHVAFQALHTQPGGEPVCHWFPENSFVFLPGKSA